MNSISSALLRGVAHVAAPGKSRGRLSILIYHRVLADVDPINTWDVTADEFAGQMRIISEVFSPLPLSEAVDRLRTGSLPPRAACVTFDDGYADNAEVALPILLRHRVPATFFIATGYLGGGRMWNDTVAAALRVMAGTYLDLTTWGIPVLRLESDDARRRAISRILATLKYLPAQEREAKTALLAEKSGIGPDRDLMMRESHVVALRTAGMEIGAHTVTHPILSKTSSDAARDEIVESGRRLGEILREPVRLFAYPNGKPGSDYGPEHVQMVRAAGYMAAVSTASAAASRASDRYQLPRFTPWDRTPMRFTLRLVNNLRQPDVRVA